MHPPIQEQKEKPDAEVADAVKIQMLQGKLGVQRKVWRTSIASICDIAVYLRD